MSGNIPELPSGDGQEGDYGDEDMGDEEGGNSLA